MAKVSVVVIDDNPEDAALLREKLKAFPEVDEVHVFTKALKGLTYLRAQQPDILFLDMQMPSISGIELYNSLAPPKRPALVMVTRHSKFSLDGFKLDAAEFILKPADYVNIAEALRKSMRRLGLPVHIPMQIERKYVFFRMRDGSCRRFIVQDIKCIEAVKNYALLHDRNGIHEIRYTMRELETELMGLHFLRIHKAYIVNIDFVANYAPGQITLEGGKSIPVSRTYKSGVDALIVGRKRGSDKSKDTASQTRERTK